MSTPSRRERVGFWIESRAVQRFIIALIVINAVILGLETDAKVMAAIGQPLTLADQIILSVFVVEIALKLYAFGWRFFKNPWNVFDFIVVAIALIPASGPLAVLRALRVLRVLRLLSMMPQLRFVVEALLKAIPGISAIGLLMALIFYVFAVMATGLFGGSFEEWFGSIGASMYTLFQVMTLESWSMGIVRPVMEVYPYAWAFFLIFILLSTFTMLNLFIGIIVDTMQTMHERDHTEQRDHIEEAVHEDTGKIEAELQAMRREMAELKSLLKAGR